MGRRARPSHRCMGSRGSSSIVALDWSTQGKLLWEQQFDDPALPNRPADRNNNRTISFEGTPVADSGSVYVAVTDRREQTADLHRLLRRRFGRCPLDAVRRGRVAGRRSTTWASWAGCRPAVTSPGDFNHRLLSLEGPTLYYQTNLGALGGDRGGDGLDAVGGELSAPGAKSVRQRRRARLEPGGGPRRPRLHRAQRRRVDLRLRFAERPAALEDRSDRRRHQALAPAGGGQGAAGRTGNRVVLFDVKTGKLLHAWPDSGKVLDGYGRGLLAGEQIYWPTQNEIQILDQRTRPACQAADQAAKDLSRQGGKPGRGRRLSDRRAGRTGWWSSARTAA